MEGTLDAYQFVLAERLHMTVAELNERMSNLEYIQWRAFDTYRSEMRDYERRKRESERPRRR